MLRIVILALCFALVATGVCSATQDASSAWNTYSSIYKFMPYPQGSGDSFQDCYLGTNFSSDFAGIMAAVGQAMSATVPSIDGDDLLNATLESWPDS